MGKEVIEQFKVFQDLLLLVKFQPCSWKRTLEKDAEFGSPRERGSKDQELHELQVQLEELLKKRCIRPSVYLGGASVFFVKKKDGTLSCALISDSWIRWQRRTSVLCQGWMISLINWKESRVSLWAKQGNTSFQKTGYDKRKSIVMLPHGCSM